MRTTFIRALAVALLATSMSAFAGTDANSAAPCANAQQDHSSQATSNAKKDKKSRNNQNKPQKDQEKDTGQFTGIWG